MIPRSLKKIDTYPPNKTLLYLQFTFPSVVSPSFSFFASSFKLIKDVSHSSDLVCW